MSTRLDDELKALEHGPLHRFEDWPNTGVPNVAAGVYTVWQGNSYIYAGMSGRGATKEDLVVVIEDGRARTARGLSTRLKSHASGRRSGDQFCIYVCDRYVVPQLTAEQRRAVGDGSISSG